MLVYEITLKDCTAVQQFCLDATACSFSVLCKQDCYAVNAKSILGLFSLTLTKPMLVEFPDCVGSDDFTKVLIFKYHGHCVEEEQPACI